MRLERPSLRWQTSLWKSCPSRLNKNSGPQRCCVTCKCSARRRIQHYGRIECEALCDSRTRRAICSLRSLYYACMAAFSASEGPCFRAIPRTCRDKKRVVSHIGRLFAVVAGDGSHTAKVVRQGEVSRFEKTGDLDLDNCQREVLYAAQSIVLSLGPKFGER